MAVCCKQWAEATGKLLSVGPSAIAYGGASAEAQIVRDDDGWSVVGCCGGQCYVLTGLKFCPWCGLELLANS
jgi:hypothetical protein